MRKQNVIYIIGFLLLCSIALNLYFAFPPARRTLLRGTYVQFEEDIPRFSLAIFHDSNRVILYDRNNFDNFLVFDEYLEYCEDEGIHRIVIDGVVHRLTVIDNNHTVLLPIVIRDELIVLQLNKISDAAVTQQLP